MKRGKLEERPTAFHLHLSIFHFGQIKDQSLGNVRGNWSFFWRCVAKTKRALRAFGCHMEFLKDSKC